MSSATRRDIIGFAATATVFTATMRSSFGQPLDTNPNGSIGPFVLPQLPYAFNALEPSIDAQTMELHHRKHHAAYVNNLNETAKVAPQIASHSMEYVLAHLDDLPDNVRTTVRNNLGGHVNHSMFWEVMSGNGGKPEGNVLVAIDRDLGGVDKFRSDFNAAGARVFGAGWVFVTVNRDGKLAIEARPNQDTPLMEGKRVLFGNDVWEHSYYLKYQNRRADYLAAWWSVINWPKIGERYKAAKQGTLAI